MSDLSSLVSLTSLVLGAVIAWFMVRYMEVDGGDEAVGFWIFLTIPITVSILLVGTGAYTWFAKIHVFDIRAGADAPPIHPIGILIIFLSIVASMLPYRFKSLFKYSLVLIVGNFLILLVLAPSIMGQVTVGQTIDFSLTEQFVSSFRVVLLVLGTFILGILGCSRLSGVEKK